MRKLLIVFGILLLASALSGCAKGEVVMELSRFGSADIECKVVAAPIIASQLGSLKDDFANDGFQVENIDEDKMQGFKAKKHFKNISEVNQVKIVRGFELNKSKNEGVKGKNAETENKKQAVIYTQGILFDTVAVRTHLDLRSNHGEEAKESQWLIKNLLQQVNLRFVLKLPTTADSSNATRTPDGGKTLVWDLVLGEDNELTAQVTYLNPYKAGAVAILGIGAGVIFWRKRKGRTKNGKTVG